MDESSIDWTPSPESVGRSALVLERSVELISGALLLFIMALTCVDVVGRYIFLSPVSGASELIALSMGVLVFVALPIVSARGAHVSIALIDHVVPSALRLPHYILVQGFSVVVLAFLSWRIFEVAAYLAAVNETTTFLGISKAPVVYVLATFAALGTILNGLVTVLSLRRSRSRAR